MRAGQAVTLILLGTSWLALAGAVGGTLVGLGGALAARLGRRRETAAGGLAALVALPFTSTVALAAFTGHRAAQIPGRRLLALGLALTGAAVSFELTRRFRRLEALARVDADADVGVGPRQQRPGELTPRLKDRIFLLGLGLVLLSIAAGICNQIVLPRLYPWFHAALAVVTGLSALGAVRLIGTATWPLALAGALAGAKAGVTAGVTARTGRGRGGITRRRKPWRGAAVFLVSVLVAAFAASRARRSQTIRFAAWERTTVTSQLLRLSPLSFRSQTFVADERSETEQHLPPLPAGPRRPDADVLLMTVDALRGDHVGAFGYTRRPTTPHIDQLATRSVRFSRAYSQAPHTSFSVASMLTGKYFPTLARLAPAEVHDPIASVLRQYTWRTAGFYPPAVFFVDAHKLKAYADSNFSFEYVKFEYLEAQKRVDQVIRYYETEKPKKSFVWVHFFEPHEPYLAHPEFPFGNTDMDRYDSEIAYADAAIGRLLAYVRDQRPGAIVILAADHGEEFDEHGGRYHGSSLFDEQVHVPLLMSIPGVSPRTIDRPVELIDITPTVLGLLDIPVPARMRGTDLGPWLATPPADPARLPPAFAEVEDKRMIVKNSEKLICDLNWGYCAYHDLGLDPGERRNLADERPERAAALRRELDEWLDGHVRFEPVLARGAANPNGEQIPRAIERGRLGDLMAGPGLAALMLSTDEPVAVRREAAELLVTLPPRQETSAQLSLAVNDRDSLVAAWAAIGAVRSGDTRATERVSRQLDDPELAARVAGPGGSGAGRAGRSGRRADAGFRALDDCHDDVMFCRLIIIKLGVLRDRRAVPALLKHLPEVQNRREMVDALGDIGDPLAIPDLIERLRHDEYVPVRAQAARALAKIGRTDVLQALERAAREDTESSVAGAAREAIQTIRSGRPG
jgi:arylsulfatase A-like enzyme/HEAT repeat protein